MADERSYFVSPNRGVLDREGFFRAPGTPIRAKEVSDIKALLRAGFVVESLDPEPAEEPAPGRPLDATPSRLAMDPATLEGMSLEQLNVLVAERAPDEQPFDTVDEAIAFLSQDFDTPRQPPEES